MRFNLIAVTLAVGLSSFVGAAPVAQAAVAEPTATSSILALATATSAPETEPEVTDENGGKWSEEATDCPAFMARPKGTIQAKRCVF
ncbi:hypothetical protein BU24DRAFT_457483 [Aaosphaeria arxii CBS 175.79]|uniref:Uncharacterized protein n=1 Tax=Aaosphaeria arxii CBS 175.79 TaxID=1450172 RepID=A0A6A5Y7G2_9PLEO|nr:uncharacterized protein BU24DRAFT_457483 [Aaosphaeria arxii CBS 175.79]KAF2021505.1 hypothetical protein BU24DRAFT_457483 [Aaosphaeria arxii CBS 175.79]